MAMRTLVRFRLNRLLCTYLVLLPLAACAPNVTHGIHGYRIATAPEPYDAINRAQMVGVLWGEPTSDTTACFWIENGLDRTALFWPYGHKALAPPLAVNDQGDKRVAEVGQRVTMAGGLLADDVSSILGCRGFTKFWGVGMVIQATGNGQARNDAKAD